MSPSGCASQATYAGAPVRLSPTIVTFPKFNLNDELRVDREILDETGLMYFVVLQYLATHDAVAHPYSSTIYRVNEAFDAVHLRRLVL